MITVHPEPVSAHTHTHADTHTLRHTCRHSLPGLRSRGPDKTGDGGDSSEDSDASALHLLTDSYAWRSLKAPPSHNLPVHGTHTHTQIDRHTHTHTDAHIHTDTHRSALHIYILLLLSPTYLPPTSFSPSHPFPRAPSNSTPSISCYLSSFLTCSSPSSTPIHHPQLQNAWTNIHTHTYTHTHPHLSGTIREGESWRDVTACWRNRVPRNRDLAALTSAVLEHSELQPLTFVTDQACLESAGEPPTGRAAETRWEEEVM